MNPDAKAVTVKALAENFERAWESGDVPVFDAHRIKLFVLACEHDGFQPRIGGRAAEASRIRSRYAPALGRRGTTSTRALCLWYGFLERPTMGGEHERPPLSGAGSRRGLCGAQDRG